MLLYLCAVLVWIRFFFLFVCDVTEKYVVEYSCL